MKYYLARMRAKDACPPQKPMTHIFWSGLGSFMAIILMSIYSKEMPFGQTDGVFLIGSFGASAVLLYGARDAICSQPRNLVGGHVVSAVVGVTVFLVMGQFAGLASALAVSLSIVAMHLTRTMHPPGGATALIAVIGGSEIHQLGYVYVLSPVLIGALIMLLVALLINNLSSNDKRHYPTYWY